MDPAVGASIVQGAGNVLGAVGGLLQQRYANKANKKMAEYQWQKDVEMWNMNNKYNSPEAQMQRLKDAGLNPALVYGQGAVGNSSGQMPKYNAPTLDYSYTPPLGQMATNAITMYQDFQIKQAQTDNLRQQNKIMQEEQRLKAWTNVYNAMTRNPRVQEQFNKAGISSNKITQQTQAIDKMATELGWMNQEVDGKKNYFRQKDYQMEARRIENLYKQKAIDKMTLDMELKQKQLEYYLVSQFGPMIMGGVKSLGAGVGNLFKKTGKGGKDAENWRKFQENLKKTGTRWPTPKN